MTANDGITESDGSGCKGFDVVRLHTVIVQCEQSLQDGLVTLVIEIFDRLR